MRRLLCCCTGATRVFDSNQLHSYSFKDDALSDEETHYLMLLSDAHKSEIRSIFQVFDRDGSGEM